MEDMYKKSLAAIDRLLEGQTDDEFMAELMWMKLKTDGFETCHPDTCHSECQGTGSCYRCEEFRDLLEG